MYNKVAIGIVFSLFFIVLVVLFSIIIIRLLIYRTKKYAQIIHEKELNHQKDITKTILETQEQVLNNISKDIHDDVGQQLTFINFQIEHLKLDHPNFETSLLPLSESVGRLSDSLRNVSQSLNANFLSQQNIYHSIENELNRIKRYTKITLESRLPIQNKYNFTATEKIVIFRIFQEIINNILKHSKATEISVLITEFPVFKMIITDNGKGFSVENIQDEQTNGLKNIKTRAEMINYTIEIQSNINKGTKIILTQLTS